MRQRIITFISVLLFLVWTAAAAVSLRSVWVKDCVAWNPDAGSILFYFQSARGRLSCSATHDVRCPGGNWGGWDCSPVRKASPLPGEYNLLGFFFWSCTDASRQTYEVIVPWWFVMGLLAIQPLRRLWQARETRTLPGFEVIQHAPATQCQDAGVRFIESSTAHLAPVARRV